jgi:hypothetical protein
MGKHAGALAIAVVIAVSVLVAAPVAGPGVRTAGAQVGVDVGDGDGGAATTGITTTAWAPVRPAVGTRSVLVVRTTYAGAGADLLNDSTVRAVMDEVAAFFLADSGGRFTTAATVRPGRLPIAPFADCSSSVEAIWREVEAALRAEGTDPLAYGSVVTYLPSPAPTTAIVPCPFAGQAEIPGRDVLVAGGQFNRRVVSHELAHTLGLVHSRALSCRAPDGTPIALAPPGREATDCTVEDYGNPYDTMGLGTGSVGSWDLMALGWLTPEQVVASGSATVRLRPLGAAPGPGVRAVVAGTADGGTLLLEYRTAAGVDAGNVAVDGVLVAMSSPAYPGLGPLLLDLSPAAAGAGGPAVPDAGLHAGQRWVDTARGVSVSVGAAGADGADVTVQAVPPPPAPPALAVVAGDHVLDVALTPGLAG